MGFAVKTSNSPENYLRRLGGGKLYYPGLDAGNWYTNTVIDYSGNKQNGTIFQTVVSKLQSGLSSLNFDGSNDYVTIGTSGFPSGNGARTIVLWANTDVLCGAGDYNVMFGFGTSAIYKSFHLMEYAATSKLALGIYGEDMASNFTFTTGTWYYIVVTLSGQAVTFEVNDVSQGSSNFANIVNTTLNWGYLGSFEDNTATRMYFWDGKIALPRVYNSLLPAVTRSQFYQKERKFFGV